ncbi:putative cell adhesion molecule [Fasciola gigantica]|uniref:Putative cell adhesion molecule n=1 Tax=Fasciola gigantica TaxID=46835 RepID=A0A504Z1B0_FASGI|nr:putative cell adhesion molecule [Fasciola gigantica]
MFGLFFDCLLSPRIRSAAVPSAPLNFRGISTDPTTIQLLWTAPDMPEGRALLGYQLRYRARPQTQGGTERDTGSGSAGSIAGSTQTISIGPEVTDYYLKGLEPSTHYYVSLAGRTANGKGVAAQIEVITKDYLFNLPSPKGVHLRTLTSNSAKLCWEPPELPRLVGSVVGYELLFGLAEQNSLGDLSPANATGVIPLPQSICCCFTMLHLTPATDYRVWLRLTLQPNQQHGPDNGSDRESIRAWMTSASERILGPVSEPQAFRTLTTSSSKSSMHGKV